jgi:tetratricopeptide (TPR) repeat protein
MMTLGATLANAHMRANQMPQSADVALAVMIAAEANGNLPVLIDASNTRGSALATMERRTEGSALLREALRLSEAEALPFQTARAINNLSLLQGADGLSSRAASLERGYEIALRVRDGGLLARFTVFHALMLYHVGQFDEAISVLADAENWGESFWKAFARQASELISWASTGDTTHLSLAREVGLPILEAHEPQYRSGASDFEARLLWLMGDLGEAYDAAFRAIPLLVHHDNRHTAVGAAIRMGDPDRLRRSTDLFDFPYGRRFDLLRMAVNAGLELIEGDPDRAATMFRDLVDRLDKAESPLMGAEWKAIFAEVMPDRPEAKEAAREAYDWFSSVGAQGYLDLYAHVWNKAEAQDATG